MTTIDLDTLTLAKGNHTTPDDGLCLLEAVAYFAGEPHSDHPICASPVLIGFGIALNDDWDTEWRQKLKPFIPRLVGTRDDQDEARGYLALDWLIRTYTPAWLDLAGLTEHATALRDLRRIVDDASWLAQADHAEKSVSAADSAARSAAYSAAYSAVGSARSAAYSAAYSAADSAAQEVLASTVETLKASALDLFSMMIDPSAVTQ